MSELVKSGSKYTDEQRRDAVVMYAVEGVGSVVSKAMNIPETTLSAWFKSDWGDAIIAEVRSANADRDIAMYSELSRKALEKAHKGIDKLGDDLSPSEIKSLVIASCAGTDKGLLLQGKATSISGKAETIEELKQTFEAMSRRSKQIEDSIVSEQ